jgi:undecaprenyl pyrophosphate phosphatase UppP
MNTSADFFNDIITVAIVIVFAKFVTHHNRHSPRTTSIYRWHALSVGLSVLAVVLGLVGVELETDPHPSIHIVAAAAMAGGVVILLVDVLVDDWRRIR